MISSRYKQLKSYLNKDYYGGMIRWLLQDKSGQSVSCDRCGNIANGIMVINSNAGPFNIPLCKKHYLETFPDTETLPAYRDYVRPERAVKPRYSVGDTVYWRHYSEMPLMQGQIVEIKENGMFRVTAGNGFAELHSFALNPGKECFLYWKDGSWKRKAMPEP